MALATQNFSISSVVDRGGYGRFIKEYYGMERADRLNAKSGESLSFRMRLNVALDSAKGFPPIFHCDIKTSNILIDSKLTAKVADFGLSRLAPLLDDYGVGPNYVSTVFRGTPVSLSPSYSVLAS